MITIFIHINIYVNIHIYVNIVQGWRSRRFYTTRICNRVRLHLYMYIGMYKYEHICKSCTGLEESEILHPAYSIEYDYICPTQLRPTLETRLLPGLYLAGQINGSTGYEVCVCVCVCTYVCECVCVCKCMCKCACVSYSATSDSRAASRLLLSRGRL